MTEKALLQSALTSGSAAAGIVAGVASADRGVVELAVAAATSKPGVTVGQLLHAAPHRFDPLQAARLAEQGSPPVGGVALPSQETVRFTTTQTLAFAPSALTKAETHENRMVMQQAFLGLTGPLGVLPQVFSEVVIRADRARNRSIGAFHDLFVHRLASLFLRASGKYRYAELVQADRSQGNDPISGAMLALAGFGTPHLRGRTNAPEAALLYFAGLFAARNRSAAGLQAMLGDNLGCPVQVIQFWERWIAVPQDEQSALTSPGRVQRFNRLGVDTFAGARVRDAQGAFRVRLGPVRLSQFQRLLPGGEMLRRLVDLVRLYAGPALEFDVQVVLAKEDIPRLRLSPEEPPRLGWTTWACGLPALADSDALVLDPDRLGL